MIHNPTSIRQTGKTWFVEDGWPSALTCLANQDDADAIVKMNTQQLRNAVSADLQSFFDLRFGLFQWLYFLFSDWRVQDC